MILIRMISFFLRVISIWGFAKMKFISNKKLNLHPVELVLFIPMIIMIRNEGRKKKVKFPHHNSFEVVVFILIGQFFISLS